MVKYMIIEKVKLILLKVKWKIKNVHNGTMIQNYFNINVASVGKKTYGYFSVFAFNNESNLKIGDYCSIAPDVTFLLSADHELHCVSTYPFKVKCLREKSEGISKGDIIVEDDVWIGYRAIILSGVTIRQGAVIAAGAVVTKDVPAYAIVAGNPAKIIKYRFNQEICNRLIKIDYSKIDNEFVEENIELLYSPLVKTFDIMSLPQKEKNSL